jgi:hypothetical protein
VKDGRHGTPKGNTFKKKRSLPASFCPRRSSSYQQGRLNMKTVMVRYKTAEAHAAANEASVHAVFDELRARTPEGLRYATYTLADGVSFVHIATIDTAHENPLTMLSSFKAFQKQLQERCVEPPVVTELRAVDSYVAKGA